MNDEIKNKIIEFYKLFNINLNISKIIKSCAVTRYFIEFDISTNTRVKKIENLIYDLANYLKIKNIRLTQNIEDGGYAFEIPNKDRDLLNIDSIMLKHEKNNVKYDDGLKVSFGLDLNNENYVVDLTKTPHLLIAGTTGSGKSVFLNTILMQLFNNYHEKYLHITLIDIKKVEFSIYKNIANTDEIATDIDRAKIVLQAILNEIEKRYKVMEKQNCRNIENYNKKMLPQNEILTYRIVVIDELADLILQNKAQKKEKGTLSIEQILVHIAQLGRACGVHLIAATQRPSSNVITGLIKANFPTRVALSVSSVTDSRIILDAKGAEKLTGKGDMLIKLNGTEELTRVQSAFVSDEEIEDFTNKLREKNKINIDKEAESEIKELQKKKRSEIGDTIAETFTCWLCGSILLSPLLGLFWLIADGFIKVSGSSSDMGNGIIFMVIFAIILIGMALPLTIFLKCFNISLKYNSLIDKQTK